MATPTSTAFIRRYLHRSIIADCSLLKTLPTTTCPICMDDFTCQNHLLRLPNCRHVFHRHCILRWLSRNNTCPLCRHVFPAEESRPFSVPISARYFRRILRQPEQESTDVVFRLNFHLRPESPPSISSPANRLEQVLVAEGFPELATRACGPFWVSVDSTSNVVLH